CRGRALRLRRRAATTAYLPQRGRSSQDESQTPLAQGRGVCCGSPAQRLSSTTALPTFPPRDSAHENVGPVRSERALPFHTFVRSRRGCAEAHRRDGRGLGGVGREGF